MQFVACFSVCYVLHTWFAIPCDRFEKKKPHQSPSDRAQFILLLIKLLQICFYYREQVFLALRLSMKKARQTMGNQTYARK